MALYGIISDIHGNLEALSAALELLAERGVERILCLGDIVGYNADPDACVRVLAELPVDAVAGNHDVIAVGKLGTGRCTDRAAFALGRTRRAIGPETRAALLALPRRLVVEDDIVLIHGGVADLCEYVTHKEQVEENSALLLQRHPRARICFFGHTHAPRLYEVRGGVAQAMPIGEGERLLPGGDSVLFINPGSIDAARRGGQRGAELAIFDSSRRAISFHRAPYDHDRAERRSRDQGYRMSRADEGIRRAARALRRGGGLLGEGLRRALGQGA